MLLLIAESKTMSADETIISKDDYLKHIPSGERLADGIMDYFSKLSVGEISAVTGFSASLSNRLHAFAYEFPNKNLGIKAIEAYTGVVFKALDYPALSDNAKLLCQGNVRIISSLYGLLYPEDIVKPYRFDYKIKNFSLPKTENWNSGLPVEALRRKSVTIDLIKELESGSHSDVVNLLPADASSCVDWKLIRRYAKVWKMDFVEFKSDEKGDGSAPVLKTPNASKLKTMRGLLLRQILQDNISDIDELKRIVSNDYICEGTPQYPDHLRFLC